MVFLLLDAVRQLLAWFTMRCSFSATNSCVNRSNVYHKRCQEGYWRVSVSTSWCFTSNKQRNNVSSSSHALILRIRVAAFYTCPKLIELVLGQKEACYRATAPLIHHRVSFGGIIAQPHAFDSYICSFHLLQLEEGSDCEAECMARWLWKPKESRRDFQQRLIESCWKREEVTTKDPRNFNKSMN